MMALKNIGTLVKITKLKIHKKILLMGKMGVSVPSRRRTRKRCQKNEDIKIHISLNSCA